MGFSRRGFLRGGLAGLAGVSLGMFRSSALARAANEPTALDSGATPILQGYTDETTAQLKLLLESLEGIELRVLAPDGSPRRLTLLSKESSPFNSSDTIFHFIASGLEPGIDFRLQLVDLETGITFDERVFRALALSGEHVRFAFLSCMNDLYLPVQDGMWDALARAEPEVIFLIGDTCYADIGSDGSERDFWRRHGESRRYLDNFCWKRLIPTLAVWDDHDFGGNNWDRTNPYREGALKCFNMYFSSAPGVALEHGPGVSQLFRFRGQRFFLMDDRYFRDPGKIENGTHWGEEQEEWLFSRLNENNEPAWIINGSQYFGGYMDKDSFEQMHADAFKRFINRLRDVKAPVVLGSGDVHFSEIMRLEKELLGYETYEIVSSSMHSFTWPNHDKKYVNPRRLDSTWHHNYVVVDCGLIERGLEMRVTSEGQNRSVYIDRKLTVTR